MGYDVTIGIPVYQSVDCIRRTMESALAQSYPSIEYFIIDDAGLDGSMDIIRNLQETHPRGGDIHVLTHQENWGVSASRNQIIDDASGQYLYFLDSDDLIAPDTIALLMQAVAVDDAEIVFGSYEKIETSGERHVYQYPSLRLFGEDQLASFAYRKYAGIQASACNYLVKTSVLRDHHLHFIHTDYWEDLVFTFDLVTYISRAVLLPDITYTYLCREGSLSNYQKRDRIAKEEIMKNVKAIDYLKETSSLLYNKVYFPHRCYNIVMTDFYMACHILKRRKEIIPFVTDMEIKEFLAHPASFRQICHFRKCLFPNIVFYILGKLPSHLSVFFVWLIGKTRRLL